jgi:glycerol-3-phosphate dehydrogenase
VRLSDIVIRRTGLGSSGRPPAAALAASARIAAAELGWDTARAAEEIAAVDRVYEIA